VTAADLAGDTWIRAHDGSAARLVDHVLHRAGVRPPIELVGRGDEPVEAQAFVAAGRGVTVAHRLNVLIDPDRIAVVPVPGPSRLIQAAVLRGNRSPLARATVEALRTVGMRRGESGTVPVSARVGGVGRRGS
jgi:DNA-binding transcriptional LysR family regulator